MPPLPTQILLLALNLALASGICLVVALAAAQCFRSLPKQHAMLVTGLLGTLLAPLPVALAWQFQLGQLPSAPMVSSDMGQSHLTDDLNARATNSLFSNRFDPRIRTDNQEPRAEERYAATQSLAERIQSASEITPGHTVTSNAQAAGNTEATLSSSSSNGATTPTMGTPIPLIVHLLGGWLVLVWAVGCASMASWRLCDWFRCQRLIRSCQPVDSRVALDAVQIAKSQIGMRQEVQLLSCRGLPAPAVVGCVHPRILLPAHVDEMFTSRQLATVLVHELTHVARKDHWTLALAIAVQAVYWWNPLITIIGRKLSEIREMICDDVATAGQKERTAYAAMIVGMAERAVLGNSNLVPLGIGESSGTELTRRIERLLSAGMRRIEVRVSTRFRAALVLVGGLVLCSAIAAQVPAPSALPDELRSQPASNQQAAEASDDDSQTKDEGDDATQHQLTLRMVDPEGQPVANARVQVRERNFQYEWLIEGKTIERGVRYTSVEANDTGVLILRLPKGVSPKFAIRTTGYGPYWAAWGLNALPDEHVVELDRARVIGGLVVDEQGEPIRGAELRFQTNYKMRPGDPNALGVGNRVTTDERGNWSVEHIPTNRKSLKLEINHPQFKPTVTSISTELFSQNEDQAFTQSIVMRKGLVVRGRVLDADGKPIEGAVVRSQFYDNLCEAVREAVSLTDGSYELVGCDARLATITAAAPAKALTQQKVQILEGMGPVDFTLQAGGHLRVRVVDRDNQPVPKTRVFFQRWSGERIGYFEFDHVDSYTDERGIWEWNEAPLEELHVDICPPGGTSLSEQPIRARAEEYLFEAPPLLRILGKVIDAETRQPIARFQVVPGVRGSPDRMNWVPSDTFDGVGGEFEYTNSHGYLAHLVKVQAEGYATAESREIASDEGTVKMLFELQPAAGIKMRVMTPDGLPAVGAKVVLGVKGSQISVRNGDINDGSTYAERTTVNAAGRFRFPQQTTRYQLVIVHETGFAHVDSERLAHPDLIRLTAWAKIQGTFRVAGKPVAGVKLYLNSGSVSSYGEDTANISTSSDLMTDNDGKFSLDRVFPGDGRIARSIMRVVNQGALEVASSQSLHATFIAGETTAVEFAGQGAELRGKLRLAAAENQANQGPVLWAFVDVDAKPQVEMREIPFPAEVHDDPDRRGDWYREWRETEDGKLWHQEYQVAVEKRRKLASYTATVATDGTFAVADVAAGEYTLSARFWDGSRTERIDARKTTISSKAASNSEKIDLGVLELK